MDQPGNVANPARCQLNRENEYTASTLSCFVLTIFLFPKFVMEGWEGFEKFGVVSSHLSPG